MLQALELVHMTESTAPAGLLVRVSRQPDKNLSLDENIAIFEAASIAPLISHIFFRRFSDGRSSQIAAYVVENADQYSHDQLTNLHHKLWLNGTAPLLYVGYQAKVDIFSCLGEAKQGKNKEWISEPVYKIASDISDAYEKARPYSAFRIADGTFWEDEKKEKFFNHSKAAHKQLIAAVQKTDHQLGGKTNSLARQLLLSTLLAKYLEDRGVFLSEANWFTRYTDGATSFTEVLKSGSVDAVRKLFYDLRKKFNGDIFVLDETQHVITQELLDKLNRLITPNLDVTTGQYYFWDIYSFQHIPVEVLSHIYQYFAEPDKGAIFTPHLVVNLMLDHLMPLTQLKGTETVLDPTCGSGIFLVAAFRRLIHAWSANRNWQRPTPDDLKKLLATSIFGIEFQEGAAKLTSFSLALAICDALQPNVIWRELRFDNIISNNIFIGDFLDNYKEVVKVATNNKGFDFIVGNPPFVKALKSQLKKEETHIPQNQLAFLIILKCISRCLTTGGGMCMLQPSSFLYPQNIHSFRKIFFQNYQITKILDFVSIRDLFNDADKQVIAILAINNKPDIEHIVEHLTFRRTNAAKSRILLELDYYDYHYVNNTDAISYRWVWKSNLLGGGRLFLSAKKFSASPTLQDYIKNQAWNSGVGYKAGQDGVHREKCDWLTGMPLIESKKLVDTVINESDIKHVDEVFFHATRPKDRYQVPMVLIRLNQHLQCAFWDKYNIAYKERILGINATNKQKDHLFDFYNSFVENRHILQAICCLFSSQILSNKSSALLKEDIDRLPWPEDGRWDFAFWESIVLDDISKYMLDYVRLGQNSSLLKETASEASLSNYCEIFIRIMHQVYPELHQCGHAQIDGLIYQAFSFSPESNVVWLQDKNWANSLRSSIFRKQGDLESFQTIRLLRVYENDTLIFVKPDRLRYWLPSIAIRDADDVVADIIINGEDAGEQNEPA